MKKFILTVIVILMFLPLVYTQSNYSQGFKAGYKEGYCHNDFGCIPPVTPVTPIVLIGEKSDSFQDGYTRGVKMGLENKANKGESNERMYSGRGGAVEFDRPAITPTEISQQYGQSMIEILKYKQIMQQKEEEVLFRIAQAEREHKEEFLSKVRQTSDQYFSFSIYPEKMEDGGYWVVAMRKYDVYDDFIVQVIDYKIVNYMMHDRKKRDAPFSTEILKGRAKMEPESPINGRTDWLSIYFMDALTILNENK